MISIGIDPGAQGAIAAIDGGDAWAEDLPVLNGEIDYDRFVAILHRRLTFFSSIIASGPPHCWLEWPTGIWKDGTPDDSFKFGRNVGDVRSTLRGSGWNCTTLHKVAPNVWKSHFGLKGKSDDPHNEAAAAFLLGLYPSFRKHIYGPREGILSGPLDALLIAHYGQVLLRHGPAPVSAGKFCRRPPRGLYTPEPDLPPRRKRTCPEDLERTDTTLA